MRKLKKLLQVFIAGIFLLLIGTHEVSALTMSSTLYSVEGGNFDAGGGDSSSTNYLLSSIAGEDYLTAATSLNFINNPGLALLPSPTPTPSSSSSTSSTTTSTTTTVVVTATPAPTSAPIAFAPSTTEEEVTTPTQLFDIALIIDEPLISDSRNLKARVTFFSFGTEPTPVDMEFIILNEKGEQLYQTMTQTTIQTEGIHNQTFENLDLTDGKYTLLLKTLYNVDVEDEFRASFEVRGQLSWLDIICRFKWVIIPVEVVAIVFLLWKKSRQRKEVPYA